MQLPVTVPGLLSASVGGARKVRVEGATLDDALGDLKSRHPNLRIHVWDETGKLREHVLVYLNDESIEWIDDARARKLKEGDELHIIQAVSGG